MKKLLLGAALCLIGLFNLSDTASAKNVVWKLSHVRPEGTTVDKDLRAFASRVSELTEGRVDIQIYPANQLGDYTVVHESVSVGAVEMACQPPAVAADKRLQILWFPYIVESWDQARKNFVSSSEFMKVAEDLLAKQDIKLLATYPVYFGGIATKKEPVEPGNPDVKKNLKVRVPPMKSFQLLANALGYQATPLPFSEAFTAIQTGIVDGVIGSGAEGYYANFRDVIENYIPVNTHFECWYLYVNMETWSSMSESDRELISKAAEEFESARLVNAEKEQGENEDKLAKYGIKVISVTDEQIDLMATKTQNEVWPQIKKDLGEKWADEVLSKIVK
ncbi:TRAP transporter substrate-binding protein DctP [Dethiosulfovibrio salsuginis]|uniref:TRAP-type C4-dicarboxylate transport system, substrate-binding protein n=1 Tax=Dethiosulfovibrio salsuginis TaxID=561720 RepID=A0A1X7K228_9BACT|nr:TRAP transporter substrate-binding protein DctP [Dethiosulfovibrio salsuginis]SMG34946.1 TRAP-type C4-dicarboxylate transport system, substrate-binding protein [Dethiosulfovibrio salsuginis]